MAIPTDLEIDAAVPNVPAVEPVPAGLPRRDLVNTILKAFRSELADLGPVYAAKFRPPTDDYAGVLLANYAAGENGGGILEFKPNFKYTGMGAIPIRENVHYHGGGVTWNMIASYAGGGGVNEIMGTILEGDGTSNCFEYQPDDLNAWSSSAASITGTTLTLGGTITGTLTDGTVVVGHGVEPGTRVVAGSGTTYTVNTAQTVSTTAMRGATPHPDGDTLKNSAINAGSIRGLAMTEFKCGMKVGSLFQAGVNHLVMDNVIAYDNLEWGYWLENVNDMVVGSMISLGNGVGQVFIGGSGTNFQNYGDGLINKIFCQGAGKYYNIRTRGIVVEARGLNTAFNDMAIGHIGINGGAFNYSAQATVTAGLKLIGVPDLSKFAYGSGVYFDTTVGNIRAKSTYFVVSQSGESGPGTITISSKKGGALVSPTVSGTPTINCRGGTHLEVCGDYLYGSGASITGFNLLHSDVESNGTAGILYQAATFSHINSNATLGNNGLVCRDMGETSGARLCSSQSALDIDGSSQRMMLTGIRPVNAKLINKMCLGVVTNDLKHALEIYMQGNGTTTPTISMDPSGAWESIRLGHMMRLNHSQQAGVTLNPNTGQVITINSSGGTLTLPTIVSDMLGLPWYISNPYGVAATVNTSSSQTVDNVSAATSITMAANSTDMLIPQQVDSTFYWARY